MLIEEFDEGLQQKIQTMEDLKEVLCFFVDDLKACRVHAKHLCHLYQTVYVSTLPSHALKMIHALAEEYLDSDTKEDVGYLYLLEMLYFYHTDSPSEVLKYANRILSLEDESFSKISAYSFSILVLTRMEMYKEVLPYIEEADIYVKNYEISRGDKLQLYSLEMDYYAAAGYPSKYESAKARMRKLINSLVNTDSYRPAYQFYVIHTISAIFRQKSITAPQKSDLSKFLKENLCVTTKNFNFSENYSRIVVPVLKYLKSCYTEEEHLEMILPLFTTIRNVSEMISLYQFLIFEVGIEESKYPELYANYYQCLSEFYKEVQENDIREAKTEILNFSLEKKFDDISAKYQVDTLTGCYNRVFLSEIEDTILEAGDHVVYIDLNDFKEVNDTYGHETGDKELVAFTSILLENFRDDIVIRLGGDEFVVYAHGVTEDILSRVESTRQQYLALHILDSLYGFSVGVLSASSIELHKAIGIADSLMYECKHQNMDVIFKEM